MSAAEFAPRTTIGLLDGMTFLVDSPVDVVRAALEAASTAAASASLQMPEGRRLEVFPAAVGYLIEERRSRLRDPAHRPSS